MTTPHPLVAAAMVRRIAAGYSIRIVFSDGHIFTGHYRSVTERDRKITAAKRMANVARVDIIEEPV